MNGRLFGPQSLSGHFDEEKNLLLFPENEQRIVGCLAPTLLTITNEISRLITLRLDIATLIMTLCLSVNVKENIRQLFGI